jgi:hypothetical protein
LLFMQAAIDRGKLRLPADDGSAKGPPDMGRVLACAQEMASALHYLHDQQINHGACLTPEPRDRLRMPSIGGVSGGCQRQTEQVADCQSAT